MVSTAVLIKAFRPLDRNLQTSKTITSLQEPSNFNFHQLNNRNIPTASRKFISTMDIHSSPTIKPKSHQGWEYLKNPNESAERYSYLSEINKVNSLPHSEDVHGNAGKIMHTRDPFDPTKLSTIKAKLTNNSHIREPSGYVVRYPQNIHPSQQISPVSYQWLPHTPGNREMEENSFDKKRRDISHQLIRTPIQASREHPIPSSHIHFQGRGPFMPSHIDSPPSKPYSDSQFPSEKQIKGNPEDPLKSTFAFDKHVLSKSLYHSEPVISSRLRTFQPDLHYNKDNSQRHNFDYLDKSSSEEYRIQGNHQPIKHLKSTQNDIRVMQLQKQSSPGFKNSNQHLSPSFHPSSFIVKPHSYYHLPLKAENNFPERPRILLPHNNQEKSSIPSNLWVKTNAPNPSLPPYQTPPQTSDQLNSRNFNHFASRDSSERTFPHFDSSTEQTLVPNHGSTDNFSPNIYRNNFPLDHLRSHDKPSIPDFINFKSNPHEKSQESESSQSEEKLFFSLHTPKEQGSGSDLPSTNLFNKPLDLHQEYTSDEEEDILAAKVKALLNPPENRSMENNQNHSGLAKDLPPTSHTLSDGTERNMSNKHVMTSDRGGGISSLESDPETESEEDPVDNKDAFSEEQHDGFLDMGAYTDKQGSFGWYADFPVGRGHDKVSYSSSK